MPKMAVRLKRKDIEGPARIVTYDNVQDDEYLWDVGNAPHIGMGGA